MLVREKGSQSLVPTGLKAQKQTMRMNRERGQREAKKRTRKRMKKQRRMHLFFKTRIFREKEKQHELEGKLRAKCYPSSVSPTKVGTGARETLEFLTNALARC